MRVLAGFIVVLGLALSVPDGAASAAEKIRLRVTQFAPNYFLKDGRWTGLDVQLAEAVVKEAGFDIEFVELPWSRALLYMETGQIDMMANLTRTPDREAFMHFVGPERISRRVLVVRREHLELPISNLDELLKASARTRLPIGIQKDAKYSEAFDSRLAGDATFARHFDAVPQGALLAKKTAGGRNLGFFEDQNYVAYQLQTNPEFQELAMHSFVLAADPVYFGVSKRAAPGVEKSLEAAFQRLEKNGTLSRIRMQWGSDK
ncbi:MAG TPA: transporter substrate-binding domain-containing protein [Paucimonas sp.]|nr:transporter substrate-binding domain-containing protein [Paucimonas sp.]